MNQNDKMMVNSIPTEALAATRRSLINILQNADVPYQLRNNLQEIISYIENRMKDQGISLNTTISQADMQKAQNYLGSFSGINSNNYYNNNSDDFDIIGNFFASLVGILIALGLIASFFNWVGNVISYLWTSGIIPAILGAIGLGATSFGIYKLYEIGFFEKIEEYLKNKKNEKFKKGTIQVKSKKKTTSKVSDKKQKGNISENGVLFAKSFIAYSAVITLLGTAGYHIIDKNEFNGKKISLSYHGRTYNQQYRPHYEFNPNLQVLLNSRSSRDIMYDVPEERSWYDPNNYSLNYQELVSIIIDNIDDVNRYIATGKFDNEAHYYHINKTLYPFLNNYDTELVEMFMDYKNAIVYYAANDMIDELYYTLNDFYIDCYLMFLEEKTYQLGNPLGMYSYRFIDASPLAKVVVLEICNSLLQINHSQASDMYCYSDKLSIGYCINFEELKDFVETKLSNAEQRTKQQKYIKYYWKYN